MRSIKGSAKVSANDKKGLWGSFSILFGSGR